jgi:hypothetical protein
MWDSLKALEANELKALQLGSEKRLEERRTEPLKGLADTTSDGTKKKRVVLSDNGWAMQRTINWTSELGNQASELRHPPTLVN